MFINVVIKLSWFILYTDHFLISSETKYNSGSGWPSFYKTLPYENDKETVERRPDDSIEGRPRIEVVCVKVGQIILITIIYQSRFMSGLALILMIVAQ